MSRWITPWAWAAPEGVGDLQGEPDGVVEGELLLPVDPRPQRLALDVGHDVVEDAGAVGELSRVEERQDVGMMEVGRDVDLAEEPLGAEAGRQLRPEDLQGHGPVVPEVFGQEDRRHAAAAELALDAVPIGHGGSKAIGDGGHGGSGGWSLYATAAGGGGPACAPRRGRHPSSGSGSPVPAPCPRRSAALGRRRASSSRRASGGGDTLSGRHSARHSCVGLLRWTEIVACTDAPSERTASAARREATGKPRTKFSAGRRPDGPRPALREGASGSRRRPARRTR